MLLSSSRCSTKRRQRAVGRRPLASLRHSQALQPLEAVAMRRLQPPVQPHALTLPARRSTSAVTSPAPRRQLRQRHRVILRTLPCSIHHPVRLLTIGRVAMVTLMHRLRMLPSQWACCVRHQLSRQQLQGMLLVGNGRNGGREGATVGQGHCHPLQHRAVRTFARRVRQATQWRAVTARCTIVGQTMS